MSLTVARTLAMAAILAGTVLAPLTAQEDADSAWDRGDMVTAERLYGQRLQADSADERALHRMGLLRAWDGSYDESLMLFDRLLALDPMNIEAAVDRARVLAWRGDVTAAIRALDEILKRRPNEIAALEARAQFAAWAGELDAALSTYDRLIAIVPEDRSVRYQRARALAWASRFVEATAAYDSLLRTDPNDRDARLGLARVLAWSNQLDSAAAVYRGVLERDPDDLEAIRGLAQTLSWKGDLWAGERMWRRALALAPDDVPTLVGLGQTLRWQGRDAAAFEVLQRAKRLDPSDRDLATQLRWVEVAVMPRVGTSLLYESDSDGNRILTLGGRAAWRPLPRIELRADGYSRDLDQVGASPLERRSRGAFLEAWTQLEPGWEVSAGVGISDTDVPGAESVGRYTLGLSSPQRYRAGGALGYTKAALDVTALLAERAVDMKELSVDFRALLPPGWNLTGGLTRATFQGTESNRRLGGNVGASRRVAREWTFGGSWRAFGFTKDRNELNDGYFNPKFYGLGEMSGRWEREFGTWITLLEAAPGVQVLSGADASASARVRALVGYRFAPGREVALSAGFSTTGLQVLRSNIGSYRYRTVGVSGSWAF